MNLCNVSDVADRWTIDELDMTLRVCKMKKHSFCNYYFSHAMSSFQHYEKIMILLRLCKKSFLKWNIKCLLKFIFNCTLQFRSANLFYIGAPFIYQQHQKHYTFSFYYVQYVKTPFTHLYCSELSQNAIISKTYLFFMKWKVINLSILLCLNRVNV